MRAASAIDIALWDLLGKAVGPPLHDCWEAAAATGSAPTTPAPANATSVDGAAQAVANWGLYEPNAEGRHEDLEAFLHSPAELARSLLDEGTTGMKIWPFDPYAEATLGHDISTAELDSGTRADPPDPGGGRAARWT